jgi:hypothetical protein
MTVVGLWRAAGLGLAVGAIQSAHFVTVYLVDLGHASAIAFTVVASTIVLWAATSVGATVRGGVLMGLGSALVSALVLAAVVWPLSIAHDAVTRWNASSYTLSHALLFACFGMVCGAVGAIASGVVRRSALRPGGGA